MSPISSSRAISAALRLISSSLSSIWYWQSCCVASWPSPGEVFLLGARDDGIHFMGYCAQSAARGALDLAALGDRVCLRRVHGVGAAGDPHPVRQMAAKGDLPLCRVVPEHAAPDAIVPRLFR